jgi:C4-dicarboxylate-specific signal transduction histidine kinase
MGAELEQPAEEIKRLQRCMNDLVSILALPAIWSGGEPQQIARTILDALMGVLQLDLVYMRLTEPLGAAPIEMVRAAPSQQPVPHPQQIGHELNAWLGDDLQRWPAAGRNRLGNETLSIIPLRLGLQGDFGVIVAGARRADFPESTERLVLSVVANQASIGMQEAKLRRQQQQIANELDRAVAQRTAELAAANDELMKEIAERKLVEAKLRRSEAFLAEGQQLSRVGSFSWRIATDEITWSEQLYRIFQFEREMHVTLALIGARIHPEDLPAFTEQLARCRRDRSELQLELRLQMPDRSVKYVHVVAHSRDDCEALEYIGAVQDVTQRRFSEEALAKVRSELSFVARVMSLGVLTASIAHEVNQPLSGIVTNASTCLRLLAAEPPNIAGALETARRTIRDAHRASEVIARLRALFNKKDAPSEAVDLNEATREVIALSLSELQRNRIVLRLDLADDLPLVTSDRVQIQQVILNLVRNASDAMSSVDDRPRQLLIRTERDEGDRVRLSVRDAGIGFDPQGTNRLFEAFYTTKHDGMGIGLSVSRSIVESHRGRLWAAVNDGPGATFSFSIPRGPGAAI